MSEENGKKKDLTTEELLKKLLENFGGDEPEEQGKQLSIEDAAKDLESRKKVYRYRVGPAGDKAPKDEPEPVHAERDALTEELERSIRDAEKYVEGMKDPVKEEEEKKEAETPEEKREDELPPELSFLAFLEKDDEYLNETEGEPEDSKEQAAIADTSVAEAAEETAKETPEEGKILEEEGKAPEESDASEEREVSEAPAEEPETPPAVKPEKKGLYTEEEPEDDAIMTLPEDGFPEQEEKEDAEEGFDADLAAYLREQGLADLIGAIGQKEKEKTEEAEDASEDAGDTGETEEKAEEIIGPEEPEEPEEQEEEKEEAAEKAETAEEAEANEESAENAENAEKEGSEEAPAPESDLDGAVDLQELARDGEESGVSLEESWPTDEETARAAAEHAEKEEARKGKEPDENEINLMMIFNMENDLEKRIGSDRMKRLKKNIEGDAKAETFEEEYESPDQNARFFSNFKKSYIWQTVRAVIAVLALAVVAVGEIILTSHTLRGELPSALVGFTLFDNPVFAALAAMQVTMLLLAVGYKEVLGGLKAIGSGRARPELFLPLSGLLTLLYEGGLIACHTTGALYYNLPLALGVALAVLHTRRNLRRTMLSFKIVSSRKEKIAVVRRNEGESHMEREAFGEFISDTSGIYGAEKTSFVKGFARRTAKEPHYLTAIGIFATVTVVIGLIFFVLGFYFGRTDNKLLGAFESAIQAICLTMPFSAFISYSLPSYKASKKAFGRDSAIIGDFSLEEYADATVISFDDKEVFPSSGVRVRSLKLYGDSRIDHVLFGAASVFHKLGGPLDDVFSVATKESGYTEEVDILEIESDGVEAAVKGALVDVGGSVFMKKRGLLPSVDPDDEAIEMEGRMSVMYLAIGGVLAAKMHIEYKPDKEIQSIMAALYKAGMCIGIRTLDPNIDDKMLRSHVDLSKYPVKVLRMERVEKEEGEPLDSGVVSKGKVKDLLKTLTSCRKVLQVIKANTAIKIIAILAGAGLAALILFTGLTGRASSLWLTVYQLFAMLPIALVSLIFA